MIEKYSTQAIKGRRRPKRSAKEPSTSAPTGRIARVMVMVQTMSPLRTWKLLARTSTRKTRTKKSKASRIQPKIPEETAKTHRGETASAVLVLLGSTEEDRDCFIHSINRVCSSESRHRKTAIQHQDRAGRIGKFPPRQHADGFPDVLRGSPSLLQQDTAFDQGVVFVLDPLGHVCLDDARTHLVYSDAKLRQAHRPELGGHGDAC